MLGIDIVDINKLKTKISDDNFKYKIFTEEEIVYAERKKNSLETYAGIFAAKEAIIKSFNLNLSYILRKKIEIKHKGNKPYFAIESLTYHENLSISHDGNYAVAVCSSNFNYKIDSSMINLLPERKLESNKGDYGRVCILGGSKGMAGSVYMASLASLKSGVGLGYIVCPKSISQILQIKATEAIIKEIDCEIFENNDKIFEEIKNISQQMDVLCIGPGMAMGNNSHLLIKNIIKDFNKNILIDADGINAIAKDTSILNLKKEIVITPHIKEFSRLINKDISYINANKKDLAIEFSSRYGMILVLKGNKTIVTDGNRYYENNSGNPGMATAGSGDVLSGIISALLARLSPFQAAKLGVYIHGLAGDIAANKLSQESMTATDIIDNLGEVFKLLRG